MCLNFLKELGAYMAFRTYGPNPTQKSSCFGIIGYPMCIRRLNKEQWYLVLHLKEHSNVFIRELISITE